VFSAVSPRATASPFFSFLLAEATMAARTDKKKAQQEQHNEQFKSQARRRIASFMVTHPNAAGIDIGSRTHWVCVGQSTDSNDGAHIREFCAYTDGLRGIVAFLREHGVTSVAMESTGIYWIPLYEMLDNEKFEVFLVDPSYTKQVRGRPKTDRRDCQWIYRLHHVGLLAAAFRPSKAVCVLRSYLRQRQTLIRYGARHVLHMQKALELMNVKLTEVIADITGMTGRRILQAILAGERDPKKLAELRDPRCHADAIEIARALDGSWRDEHLFGLKLAYELWQTYQQKLDETDARIAQQLTSMKLDRPLLELPSDPKSRSRKPNDPRFDVRDAVYKVLGMDLQAIEGIADLTALTLLAEIGPDVSKFPTVQHFTSWLGLCPCLKKTGGKVKSSRTRPGVNRAAQALRMAANSLWQSKSAMGAFYRRMKARLGAQKAVTASARKLAERVYYALKYGLPYVKQTEEQYEAMTRARLVKSLQRRARQLGFELRVPGEVPNEAETEASKS
jgi:transposase